MPRDIVALSANARRVTMTLKGDNHMVAAQKDIVQDCRRCRRAVSLNRMPRDKCATPRCATACTAVGHRLQG
eukprot:5120863-Pyramimonas_sp.AAC.1